MRYVKKYEDYNKTNEEFLGDIYNAAKGALKNFLGNIMAPFKSLKDDFKKGMEREQVKKTMLTKVDALFKAAVDGINKAEDETTLNDMRVDFMKQIDDLIADFDKEIKTIKEAYLINESKAKDALITAVVALGLLRKKADGIKDDFDKKLNDTKDLPTKKTLVISEIKSIIDDFKKNINNDQVFKKEEDTYKSTNKISITQPSDYTPGESIIYLRKDQKREAWDALTDEQKLAPTTDPIAKTIVNVKKVDKIEGDNFTFTGNDGKQIIKNINDIIGKSAVPGVDDVDVEQLKKDLGELKTDKEQMSRVSRFVDFIKNKSDKLPEIDRLLGETPE